MAFFGDDIDVDVVVDVVVDESVSDVDVVFNLILEVSFTVGVAPGIDDNAAPVDAVDGDRGSSGKLSVYNTLAELLHRTNRM